MVDVVLVFYANESHSEVPTNRYLTMLKDDSDLHQMIKAVDKHQVPVTWSSQAMDLLLLASAAPRIYDDLVASPYWALINGLYTHVLPSFHPEHLDKQLQFGRETFNLAKANEVVGMLPEFDMSAGAIQYLKAAGWKYVLLQHGVNTVHPKSPSDSSANGEVVSLQDALGNELAAVMTHGPELRTAYLKMLRGLVSPDEMVAALVEQSQRSKELCSPVMAFLIDLEAVQINGAVDTFVQFVERLGEAQAAKTLSLAHFGSEVVAKLDKYLSSGQAAVCRIATRPKPKWSLCQDPLALADALKSLDVEGMSPYHQRAYLWATNSDLYSAQFAYRRSPDGVLARLPKQKPDGWPDAEVVIQADARRVQETSYLVRVVQAKGQIGEQPGWADLDPCSQTKLRLLDDLFRQ